MGLKQHIVREDKIGSAVRYKPQSGKSWFSSSQGRKLYIEPGALDYILSLNGYDQQQIRKGIEELSAVANPENGLVNQQRPAHFKAKPLSVSVFNFIVKYQVASDKVIVSEIRLNRSILGQHNPTRNERQSLYTVKRNKNTKFNSKTTPKDVRMLEENWRLGLPTTKVKTRHAAVNGMLNDLEKATWLMGVHADTAFENDDFSEFTLFHNPSESGGLDFYECVKDNLGFTTENAKHLAAILADVQKSAQPVKWVVHSQGGIIFKQAVAHHLKKHPNSRLDKNSVAFHSGGNNKAETQKLLAQAGIKKETPDRDNPFDIVPNIAGRNDLSLSSIKRSFQFAGKVFGIGNPGPEESPHTLPFLSLEAYHRFLTLANDDVSASRVRKYMADQRRSSK